MQSVGMHRLWDFTDEVGPLSAVEEADLARARHEHRVERLVGLITDVTADSFTVLEPDGRSSTWPLRGWVSDYRRGLLCSIALGEDEVVGIGDTAHLRYVTIPEVSEVWVQSRGLA